MPLSSWRRQRVSHGAATAPRPMANAHSLKLRLVVITTLPACARGDDQQLVAGRTICFCSRSSLRSSLASISSWREPARRHQFKPAGECGGGDKAHGQALLAGGQPEAEGNVGLAGARRARGDDVLTPFHPFATRRFQQVLTASPTHAADLSCRPVADAADHPVPKGAGGASWAKPKLQGFAANHPESCRPWREKPHRFNVKSMG